LNGWATVLGAPRAIVYGIPSAAGGWLDDQRDTTPPNAGNGFFSGGFVESSIMTQTIDVSANTAAIDTGAVGFTLSGWLGGFAAQNDHASLDIEFHDANGGILSDASIGGPCGVSSAVCASDRGSETGLRMRDISGTVPAQARTIFVVLTLDRSTGSSNDGYADNLSLVLSQ